MKTNQIILIGYFTSLALTILISPFIPFILLVSIFMVIGATDVISCCKDSKSECGTTCCTPNEE